MFVWVGTSKSAKRVKGGSKQQAFCPECGQATTFVEVEVVEAITLFSVIDLFDDRERAFRCIDCDSIGQIVDSGELPAGALEDLSPEAAERLERARAEERRARAAVERERRERERREREVRADSELASLKARMGLDPEPEPEPEAEPSKRQWWRFWQR